MARTLEFQLGESQFTTPIEKVDRSKLYGRVEKKYVDRDGNDCYFGSLSEDGITIFGKEAFESGYMTEGGEWKERSDLKAVDIEGNELAQKEASFKQTITLDKKISIDDYLSHVAKSVYQLDDPSLLAEVKNSPDDIYTFEFNYTASYAPDTAFLIANDDTLFMVVGQETKFDFLEPHQIEPALLTEDDDEDDDGDDIDFSMF